MKELIHNILEEKGRGKDAVIPILQSIQKAYNFLPEEALRMVCEDSDITHAEIIGVAGFYAQFRFRPAGKHLIKICTGTACHVKGAGLVYDAVMRELNLKPGEDTDAKRLYTLQKVSCLGCCTLAPVVQIDDVTYGHIKPSMVGEILDDFSLHVTSGQSKDLAVFKKKPMQGEIRLGLGSCCVASGSDEVRKAVSEQIKRDSLHVDIKQVGCVGMCHQVPLVEVLPKDKPAVLYAKVKPEDVKRIVSHHFKPEGLLNRFKSSFNGWVDSIQQGDSVDVVEKYGVDMREAHVHAFLGNQKPIATEHRGMMSPLNLDEYLAHGGFEGLKKALELSPGQVIETVKTSGIRGRGGAGFPTGLKWALTAENAAEKKYIICNGDEGDPGAFMDRMLLESYPFRVLEGMLIAAWAVGATDGLLYIRAEYPLAVTRIRSAIRICEENNLIGDNILGTGFSIHLRVKEGAGAFVCGEESAMIASIEGKRGFPSLRPPYPAQKGLFGYPTLINNTETLAQIPYILRLGAGVFASIGTEKSKGTKVFALAGKINRGGLIEVPIGITIRQIVDDIGGGVQQGRKMKAVQIGGPSGGCIPYDLADTQVDYNTLSELGAMMGSGGLVVLDETDCMVDMARYFLSFTQSESCGKCTFCRIGTRRMLDILNRICEGKGVEQDLAELEALALTTQKGSLCGLGKTAPNPVLSTLKYFRDEYEAHIQGRCPSGKCKHLIAYHVSDDCIGCTICAQECPSDAIAFAPHEKHVIDTDKCIQCDICKQACPVDAIYVN